MALNKGNEACSAGLSKEIWDLMKGSGYPGEQFETESAEDYAVREENLQKMCYAISSAVVDHFKNNADVVNVATNVTTTVAIGIPATCPPPSGVGATTGPGSGSGSGTQSGTGNIQ